MAKPLPQNLTEMANNAQHDPEAARQFLSAVYDILREIAHKQSNRHPGAGEGPTEVAHEVASEMLKKPAEPMKYANRQHVLGGLATRIGNKVIDLAKRRKRVKRGGGAAHLPIDSPAALGASAPQRDLAETMAVEDAFAQLAAKHPNAYQVLLLRNQRHSVEEVADRLDVSPKTVIRWTKFGTAFLYGLLSGGEGPPAPDPSARQSRDQSDR